MAKRSASEWQALIEQHRTSGLSQAAFCKQHRICSKRFAHHKKRLSAEASVAPFIRAKPEVKVAVEPVHITIEWGALTLHMPLTQPTLAADFIKALA